MTDHAARVRAQLQREAEQRDAEQLLDLASPLIYTLYLAAFLAVLCIGVDGWQRYRDMAAANEALVQCINGQRMKLGGAILRCEISEYNLVPGIPPSHPQGGRL